MQLGFNDGLHQYESRRHALIVLIQLISIKMLFSKIVGGCVKERNWSIIAEEMELIVGNHITPRS